MGIYQKYLLPRITNIVCSAKPIRRQRQKVVPMAAGQVLEIGIGSGLNLPYYDPDRVERLWGLEPAVEMTAMALRRVNQVPFPVEFVDSAAEDIHLDAASIDTVVVTYSLCTIPDVGAALSGIRRVLKENGRLIFCEHGLAPDASVQKWQRRLNPLWRRLGGGCNLDRPIPQMIEQGGFTIDTIECSYIPGWKPASFNYWGSASAT